MSQPSRTIQYIYMKFGIEHEYIHVDIPADTRSEEFKKNVNPEGCIPVIEVDGEKMVQSGAIARFLLDSYDKDEVLLPRTDRKARARVEMMLDISANKIRNPFTDTFRRIALYPLIGVPHPSEEEKEEMMSKVYDTFSYIDTIVKDKPYVAGDKLSIADIQIYNEVFNVWAILSLDTNEYPNILEWRKRVNSDPIISILDTKFYEFLEPFKAMLRKIHQDTLQAQASMTNTSTVTMPHRSLGNSGLKVSVLSFGNWLTADDPEEERLSIDCIKAAYEGGITTFDTAEIYGYGNGEIAMGKALKELNADRSNLVITTKIWKCSDSGINDTFLSRKHIFEGLKNSLKRLQLEYVDVVFAHRPDYETPLEETCRAFDFVIEEGLAFYWGTSEWPVDMIAKAMEICDRLGLNKPIAEQCQYNMLKRENTEKNLRPAFEDYGYGTTIWSPLLGGLLSGKYNKLELPEGSRYKENQKAQGIWKKHLSTYEEDHLKEILQGLEKLANENEWTQAQLCLAWCVANKDVTTTILGASKPEQVHENLKALDLARRWSPKIEEAINNLLNNEPTPAIDFTTFKPMKPRRGLRVDYTLGQ